MRENHSVTPKQTDTTTDRKIIDLAKSELNYRQSPARPAAVRPGSFRYTRARHFHQSAFAAATAVRNVVTPGTSLRCSAMRSHSYSPISKSMSVALGVTTSARPSVESNAKPTLHICVPHDTRSDKNKNTLPVLSEGQPGKRRSTAGYFGFGVRPSKHPGVVQYSGSPGTANRSSHSQLKQHNPTARRTPLSRKGEVRRCPMKATTTAGFFI